MIKYVLPLFLLAACTKEEPPPPAPKPVVAEKPAPASAPAPVPPAAPPFDVAKGTAALTATPWEGTIGDKPAKATFTDKDGKVTGNITEGKNKIVVDASIDAKGVLTMVAVPRPSPQGTINQTYKGKFEDETMGKLSGTLDETVKQGFVEQGGESKFVFVKGEAKPAKGGKKKK